MSPFCIFNLWVNGNHQIYLILLAKKRIKNKKKRGLIEKIWCKVIIHSPKIREVKEVLSTFFFLLLFKLWMNGNHQICLIRKEKIKRKGCLIEKMWCKIIIHSPKVLEVKEVLSKKNLICEWMVIIKYIWFYRQKREEKIKKEKGA